MAKREPANFAGQPWTAAEERTLREMYPKIGREVAVAMGRTKMAVSMRAHKLGLKSPKGAVQIEAIARRKKVREDLAAKRRNAKPWCKLEVIRS